MSLFGLAVGCFLAALGAVATVSPGTVTAYRSFQTRRWDAEYDESTHRTVRGLGLALLLAGLLGVGLSLP